MHHFDRFLAAFIAGLLLLAAGGARANETLHYLAEMRNALTLWNWSGIATVELTTRDTVVCPGGGHCRETEVWMTSEGVSSSLEALYPLRSLYRTAYRPEEKTTLAFEEVLKRRKTGPGEYQWRHRVIWLAGGVDAATRYDFDESGTGIPELVGAWITTGKAEGLTLKLKNSRTVPMPLPALDRWGTFQLLRTLDLAAGASWMLPGAGPKGPLTFEVVVEHKEHIQAAGRTWETWKVRIDEGRSEVTGTDPGPLYAWIGTDAARTPVRFDMDHEIGRLRLILVE